MRNLLILLLIVLGCYNADAQILKPGKIFAEPFEGEAKVGDVIELQFRVQIDKNWYMYTTGFDTTCGPLPAEITLDLNGFTIAGGLKAIGDKSKHDPIFDCEVRYIEGEGMLSQKIKLTKAGPLEIKGIFEIQTCSNVSGQCVAFEGDLFFPVINVKTGSAGVSATPKEPKQTPEKAVIQIDTLSGKAGKDTASDSDIKKTTPSAAQEKNKGPILSAEISRATDYSDDDSTWAYMLIAFILGITSLITPCVFPMIPMTVTFFLKDGQTKKQGIRVAMLFGLSIIVIYTVVGTIFAAAFGAEGLNALATHWLPNLLIFILFIVFALSFLGLFEINAPYQLVNKADRAAEKGGYAGIFFMSATLVLVSFSCTIPLVGNVLVMAAGGQIIKPILGMFAYSLAFAIPFTLFAMFPEWLKSLPKSGGWLNTVKVTLGLLELALALKFFSIVDQTYHWGLLDRDVNIAIWIVIFTVLGFYLLGKIRLSSDTVVEKVNVARLLLSISVFSFVVYLVPGLWGAPLKMLAGYLPPMHTHDFDLIAATRGSDKNETCGIPLYSDILQLPLGLQGYFDYDQALACAREQNKPLFIDFTGHGCTNCREMEAVVWADPAVLQRLTNDYVVVALYVDDKTELPEEKWYTSSYDGKVKKTIGKQNADLQIRQLNNNAQPFYVLVGADESVLVAPYSYNRNPKDFVTFLDTGKKKYHDLYGAPAE